MPAEAKLDWQRTSPTAVVIFLGRALKALAVHGAPALVPLAATFVTVEALRLVWLALALIPFLLLLSGWSVLSYLRFRFRLGDGLVVLKRGVLQHERVTVEFGRVQNVSIQEPFFMRPLGLAVLSDRHRRQPEPGDHARRGSRKQRWPHEMRDGHPEADRRRSTGRRRKRGRRAAGRAGSRDLGERLLIERSAATDRTPRPDARAVSSGSRSSGGFRRRFRRRASGSPTCDEVGRRSG